MSSWGRNNQSVTANSTTVIETSNGAPIGIASYVKNGSNVAGANASFGNTSPGSVASVDVALFNNTSPGAFVNNQAVGVFGVTPSELANNAASGSKEVVPHVGWNLRRAGTGPIVNVGYSGTATGYSNTDNIVVSSPQAGGNAAISLTTNSTGGALVLTINTPGAGFLDVNATANVVVTNSTGGATGGSGATFFAVAGGRAGRVSYETLVAMGSLGQTSGKYGTSALVTHSNTANTQFPDPN